MFDSRNKKILLVVGILVLLSGGYFAYSKFYKKKPITNNNGATNSECSKEPEVKEFKAEPTSIKPGEKTKLTWSVEGAKLVQIDEGIGTVKHEDSLEVSPKETTLYTLIATCLEFESKSQVTVIVIEPFAVKKASATASPANYSGSCPKTITFSGSITVNAPGSVNYRWERSDGTILPTETLTFTDVLTKSTVNDAVTLDVGSYSGWARINVISPNALLSEKAEFKLECDFKVLTVKVTTSESNYSGDCGVINVKFTVTFTANKAGTAQYIWKQSDGSNQTRSVTFDSAGNANPRTENWGWTTSGSGSGQAEVTSPNRITSNNANFTVTCT